MTVVLDFDGTLITCEPRQSAVLHSILIRYGVELDLKHLWEQKREGVSTLRALEALGIKSDSARNITHEWQSMIEDPVWLGLDSELPGVSATISAIRETSTMLTLLTARSRPEWVKMQLNQLGLLNHFDKVIIVSPEHAVEEKAEALLKLRTDAFFGDTESDWRASLKAKTPFYAVSSGQRSGKFLKEYGVKIVSMNLHAAWNEFMAINKSRVV